MNLLITTYFFASIAIAVSAWSNGGWTAGLSAFGTGAVSLVAGGGLKASLWWGDKAQKIGGLVIATILMALSSYFMAPRFSVHLFDFTATGQEWGWLGAAICFLFTDKK
jgi:hypothetical protein